LKKLSPVNTPLFLKPAAFENPLKKRAVLNSDKGAIPPARVNQFYCSSHISTIKIRAPPPDRPTKNKNGGHLELNLPPLKKGGCGATLIYGPLSQNVPGGRKKTPKKIGFPKRNLTQPHKMFSKKIKCGPNLGN